MIVHLSEEVQSWWKYDPQTREDPKHVVCEIEDAKELENQTKYVRQH